MITKEEIQKIAFQAKLDAPQIEKDYVLGWLLAGIACHPILSKLWIFKGGTCLRKVYFENYRYSEDLDFTIVKGEALAINDANKLANEVASWVSKKSGIIIDTNRSIFESLQNSSDQNISQGRLYYRGPISPQSPRQWPRIKFDITADEIVVEQPEMKQIIHPYSDYKLLEDCLIKTYSMYDLFAEKIRALFERTRPRDLYDVVEIYKKFENIDFVKLAGCLIKKFSFKKMELMNLDTLKIEACEAGWDDQLSHQLSNLSGFQRYMEEFKIIYEKIQLELASLDNKIDIT